VQKSQPIFLAPPFDSKSRYRENLNIGIYPSGGMSLAEFISQSINYLRQNFKDFKIIESNSTTISFNPAYMIVFKHKNTLAPIPFEFKNMQVWTIKDGKVYILSYNADSSKYDYYLPIIKSMIESFFIESLSDLGAINSAGIRVGIMPLSIAFNPNNNKIYITNLRSNYVSVIDGFKDIVV
jgi:hypothetical protein